MTQEKPEKLERPVYILMISLHGLIRAENMELGRDADTGGQIGYVVEFARHLAKHPGVERVDLFTRLIEDVSISDEYSQPEERLDENAKIIRLPFGPKRYLRKESLWPHLNQAVDKCLNFLRAQGRLPDFIHTHYADAGYVGEQLSLLLGIPLIHTGHSLGRPKRERMLASGRKEQAIEKQFNFTQRIATEELVIQQSSLIITSTQQEIKEQYGMYANFDKARFSVIPPGVDTSRFSLPGRKKIVSTTQASVDRFFSEPDKQMIISISRPDVRKNIRGLIRAYGQSPELQSLANLLVIAGSRESIVDLEESQQKVLMELLLEIDYYDLWGKVAIPKHMTQDEIPELYRLAAKRKGVFVNAALTEPFGLTLIEAAASGLPIVAPDDGGPRDIVSNCRNGVLANTLDSDSIAKSMCYVLEDPKRWRQFATNGVVGVWRYYSWASHVEKYMKETRKLLRRNQKHIRRQQAIQQTLTELKMPLVKAALISDIDNTLLGDSVALRKLMDWVGSKPAKLAFCVATGRPIKSTLEILRKNQVRIPDVMITSVGTEIHYGKRLVPDVGWAAHIRHQWRRDALVDALSKFSKMRLQAPENQREFKISYLSTPGQMPPVKEMNEYLQDLKLQAQLIYSHEEFLDVLPIRASKGHAIRYLSYKWGLPLGNCIVAGDSGNDVEMLMGDTLAIVVGNHSPEVTHLRDQEQIYFAESHYAAGIIEGIAYYQQELDSVLGRDEVEPNHV